MTVRTVLERFDKYVSPEPMSGCLLWSGTADQRGYGQLRINGRLRKAHRVAWELARGPIPPGLNALHRCDVPSCVNVDHLFLGTQAENMADAARKGRTASGARSGLHTHPETRALGELNGYAKLTRAKVDEIRALYTGSRGQQADLARRYGVTKSTIKSVVYGQRWIY